MKSKPSKHPCSCPKCGGIELENKTDIMTVSAYVADGVLSLTPVIPKRMVIQCITCGNHVTIDIGDPDHCRVINTRGQRVTTTDPGKVREDVLQVQPVQSSVQNDARESGAR